MLGIIPPGRLALIPEQWQDRHEFCFYLHDAMVDLLKEAEAFGIATLQFKFNDKEEANAFVEKDDPIGFFLDTGRTDIARRIALNQVVPALYADFLHFVFEALSCLERRKITAAYSLLRKPLQQNLLFATWALADETDFFDQLRRSPADHMEEKKLPLARRVKLFSEALQRIQHHGFLDGQLLNDILYDKELPTGFAHLFAKANHLVTSRGKLARTEDFNLNFIFKSPTDDDVYEHIYWGLAYVLFFALLLQIALYSRMRLVEPSFTGWVTMASMGAYCGLFVEGSNPLAISFQKSLGRFLVCPHCKAKVKIAKSRSARFFLMQKLHCRNCRNDYDFPLFWLLSQVDWKMTGDINDRQKAKTGTKADSPQE